MTAHPEPTVQPASVDLATSSDSSGSRPVETAAAESQFGYRPIPSQVDLPAMEQEVLEFWRRHDTFAASLAIRDGAPQWVFYEGPPTANGLPGTHHVEARVFKDVFPRYRTMKGYHVPRKAGWDCHGLPVEIAVEKELGFSGKQDIEAYGVAEFNARCRESVRRYVGAFEEMTVRMGYWVDMTQAYWTMNPTYIDSVWWSLKQVWDAGLLGQDHRVAPWCPRCGTTLSDHELGQEGGYETVVDPSVFVRCAVTGGPLAELGAALLVWTTTPWTLVSNTAVAVNPDARYVVARTAAGDVLVVAAELADETLGAGYEVLQELSGRELERTPYEPPFDLVEIPDAHFVVLGDYVTTGEGSGLVHQSPAFGAEDLEVCRAYGLPVVNPVRPDGTFEPEIRLVGGQFFKHADTDLVRDLQERGLLYRHEPYEHAYPHCWRCHNPLIYYAQPAWYIRTTAVKDALLEENERTNWYPETHKWGRYGDWLRNNVDWALSRNRYWGTPLPVWVCDEGHQTCVASRDELGKLAGRDLSALDSHRPYVDEVTLDCPTCGEQALRVPEVIDVWYDSGSMPFAQWGYPRVEGSDALLDEQFPGQFICEAIDQTRGWFYSMMVVPTLALGRSSYENVLVLGLLVDEEGRKMSKHLGNVLEPISLMDRHGADAVRWFMAASGSPWQPRRIGHGVLQEVVRKTLLTYWNTAAFQALYARIAGWTPATGPVPPPAERPLLDRWLLSEVHSLTRDVDAALDHFDTQRAGRLLAQFVDDLSNWYVRRSRRRFWDGEPAALATLHEAVERLTRLMAPFVPFITERIWQDAVRPVTADVPESVHLSDWPEVDAGLVDPDLAGQVALVRRLVELGRAARASSRVRNRQPLSRALVAAPSWDRLPAELRREVADELNVTEVIPLGSMGTELVDVTVKASYRNLGRRFGKQTPAVAAALSEVDPATFVERLRRDGQATVDVTGQPASLTEDDVIISETPREEWAVASEGAETVALDLVLTPQLRRAGLAREVVRLLQEGRKVAGLEVTDRIVLWWRADDMQSDSAEALRTLSDQIAADVLARSVVEGEPDAADPDVQAVRSGELGVSLWFRRT